MTRFLFTLLLLVVAKPALAAPIAADISSHKVEIFSGFTGTSLLLFGARNDAGDIVVVIRSPQQDMIVRKKIRTAGIWVNRGESQFTDIPQFYAIASSRPIAEIKGTELFHPLEIFDTNVEQEPDEYKQALRRISTKTGLHSATIGEVEFMGETLFKARFNFPDNIPRGTYTAEIYLFSDGQLSGIQTIPIQVYKIGFDAFVYDAAQHHSLLYGLCAVLMALSLGWFASWLFQRI